MNKKIFVLLKLRKQKAPVFTGALFLEAEKEVLTPHILFY
jgi:hypothetical protein